MKDKAENLGVVTSVDGEIKIVDYVQSENMHGRQWTICKLEDDSIAFNLKSNPEGSFETVEQGLRLTYKTFALLQLMMIQADNQFDINSKELLEDMLKKQDSALIYKAPKQDEEV